MKKIYIYILLITTIYQSSILATCFSKNFLFRLFRHKNNKIYIYEEKDENSLAEKSMYRFTQQVTQFNETLNKSNKNLEEIVTLGKQIAENYQESKLLPAQKKQLKMIQKVIQSIN